MKKQNIAPKPDPILTQSPIIIAIIQNDIKEVENLIESGESVNEIDRSTHFYNNKGVLVERGFRYYPVDLATLLDRDEIRDLLLSKGAIPNRTESVAYKVRAAARNLTK